MMEKVYSVDLTWEELQLLDGKVREKAQKVIDKARIEQSIGFDLPIMNEIIRKSLETGTLTWVRKSIRSCDYCDKERTYQRYKRSSRYHNKGDFDYDKPVYYGGIAFNEGFIAIKGLGDMCSECCSNHKVLERLIDYIWEKDLKIQIQSNNYRPGKYLKDPIYSCKDCGEEFPESKMGRDAAVFSGYYPSRCPHCDSKNTSKTNEFTFELNPRAFSEVLEIEKSVEQYNESLPDSNGKMSFYQSQRNRDAFIVEIRDRNYFRALSFNTKKKTYKITGAYPEIEAEWEEVLKREGYSNPNPPSRPRKNREFIPRK